MRRPSPLLAVAALALAACPASFHGLTTSGPVDCGGPVVSATDSSGTMPGSGPFTLNDGAGNELQIPAGRAPAGTKFRIRRTGGVRTRIVSFDADQPVDSATVALNITGCPTSRVTVGYRNGSNWDDVGGNITFTGSTTTISSNKLGHLSTYALVGN